MKKLLLLPMILSLALMLGSCQTAPAKNELSIPDFFLVQPSRPVLMEIPADSSGAIKALVTNLSRMESYVEKLEFYIDSLRIYYMNVIEIIMR